MQQKQLALLVEPLLTTSSRSRRFVLHSSLGHD
jgi:hypothetical protein